VAQPYLGFSNLVIVQFLNVYQSKEEFRISKLYQDSRSFETQGFHFNFVTSVV
jgi:hypothetical protein